MVVCLMHLPDYWEPSWGHYIIYTMALEGLGISSVPIYTTLM